MAIVECPTCGSRLIVRPGGWVTHQPDGSHTYEPPKEDDPSVQEQGVTVPKEV